MRQLARDHGAISEGRCIPRFQVYRISAQIDYLLVWRSIRRDAPGLNAGSNAGVENASRSFDAPREPRQFTRLGPHHDKSCSRFENEPCLMRLPSGHGWCVCAVCCDVT